MYEFAYNEVIEDSRQTLRARERQAMDRVISMLRAAQDRGPQSRERVDALFYLQSAPMVNGENIRIDGGAHAGAKW